LYCTEQRRARKRNSENTPTHAGWKQRVGTEESMMDKGRDES